MSFGDGDCLVLCFVFVSDPRLLHWHLLLVADGSVDFFSSDFLHCVLFLNFVWLLNGFIIYFFDVLLEEFGVFVVFFRFYAYLFFVEFDKFHHFC